MSCDDRSESQRGECCHDVRAVLEFVFRSSRLPRLLTSTKISSEEAPRFAAMSIVVYMNSVGTRPRAFMYLRTPKAFLKSLFLTSKSNMQEHVTPLGTINLEVFIDSNRLSPVSTRPDLPQASIVAVHAATTSFTLLTKKLPPALSRG